MASQPQLAYNVFDRNTLHKRHEHKPSLPSAGTYVIIVAFLRNDFQSSNGLTQRHVEAVQGCKDATAADASTAVYHHRGLMRALRQHVSYEQGVESRNRSALGRCRLP